MRRGGHGESAAPWRAARNHVGTHNKVKTLRFTHLTGFPLRLLGRGMQSGTVAGWGAPREETGDGFGGSPFFTLYVCVYPLSSASFDFNCLFVIFEVQI